MNNFRMRYAEFMRGRNGTDELYIAAIAVYLLLIVINVFVRSRILSAVAWIIFILAMFRFFSKDTYRRQAENQKFLQIVERFKNFSFKRDPYEVKPKKKSKLKKKIDALKMRFRDRKTHVFKKCPSCSAVIRLPKRKGEHTVCCPRCSKDFNVKIR